MRKFQENNPRYQPREDFQNYMSGLVASTSYRIHLVLQQLDRDNQGKGPSTHDEEFANEYSTNIRRRIIYNFNLILFCATPFFVKFLDLPVGFRKFYILKKSC